MQKSNFNFYKANDVYSELFFKFPKTLVYSDQYKKLSSNAKIAYVILRERLEFSLKNDWVDENNNVYFIFTIKEMQELFNVSNKTAIKIKKELESANLLLQKKQGFNKKTGKNEPNRLYLAGLEKNVQFIYKNKKSIVNKPKTIENNGSVQHSLPEKMDSHVSHYEQSLENSGSVHYTLPEKMDSHVSHYEQSLENNGSVRSTLNKDKDINKDNNRYIYESKKLKNKKNKSKSKKINLNKSNYSRYDLDLQNKDLETHLVEIYKSELTSKNLIFGWKIMHLLYLWTNDSEERKEIIRIILCAKKNVEKENSKIKLNIKDDKLQNLITLVLRRCFKTIRSKKVKNQEGYIYQALKNLYISFWDKYYNSKKDENDKKSWEKAFLEKLDSNNYDPKDTKEIDVLIEKEEEKRKKLEEKFKQENRKKVIE